MLLVQYIKSSKHVSYNQSSYQSLNGALIQARVEILLFRMEIQSPDLRALSQLHIQSETVSQYTVEHMPIEYTYIFVTDKNLKIYI